MQQGKDQWTNQSVQFSDQEIGYYSSLFNSKAGSRKSIDIRVTSYKSGSYRHLEDIQS